MRSHWWIFGLLLVGACGDVERSHTGVPSATDCATAPECPVGTILVGSISSKGGSDVSGGYDPSSYVAEGAYTPVGDVSCDWGCEVIAPCPEGQFPVITDDCYTCGLIDEDGEVVTGACDER